jgi:hypothetical protein
MVYSRAECVSTIEYYFASKPLAATREAYPGKKAPDKTIIHGLVTTLGTFECLRECGGYMS